MKRQLRLWVLLTWPLAFVVWGCSDGSGKGKTKYDRPKKYDPPMFKGQVGEIIFKNTSLYPVTVTLWHPDNGEEFPCHPPLVVKGCESLKLLSDGKSIPVGDDWGVQLGYSEGGVIKTDSRIKPISQFAKWDETGRVFHISVELFQGSDNGP